MMMKCLKLAGLMAAGVLVLSAAIVASASAVEMKLPSFSNVTTNTGADKGGASNIFDALNVKCPKSTSQFSVSADGKEGTFTFDFDECTAVGEECHGLGDKPGIILKGGSWRMVLDTLAGADDRLILFEPAEVHEECKVLSSLVSLKGNVLGRITGARGTVFDILTNATSASGQEFKQYENDSGTLIKTQILSSTNEGTFAESGLDLGEDTLTMGNETELIN
jgi:hypothetical protein